MWVWFAHAHKFFILDAGIEKEQKQELGWRVSVLPIPAFHHSELYNYALHVHSGMQEWIPSIPILVYFSIPTSNIKYLLLVILVYLSYTCTYIRT